MPVGMKKMQSELTEDKKAQVLEILKSKLPQDATPVFASISGSRAKGLYGSQSDYDCKVIVIYPKRKYMLQKAENKKIAETIKGQFNVEGTVIDIL